MDRADVLAAPLVCPGSGLKNRFAGIDLFIPSRFIPSRRPNWKIFQRGVIEVSKAKLSIVAAFVVGALAASFGFVQAVSSPEAEAAAGPTMVMVKDMPPGSPQGYEPAEVAVKAGQVVKWKNEGAEAHTVTAEDGSFDSGSMAPGAEFQFTFPKAGTFTYKCTPHPWATGTVKVG